MTKTVLVTGATDGIGLETAKLLVAAGHDVLAHGRSLAKLDAAREILSTGPGPVRVFQADLSRLEDVGMLAGSVAEATGHLDALINNAGVFRTPDELAPNGLDVRFVVNTIAPYVLTRRLMPKLGTDSRVVNLSSAAQAPVDLAAIEGKKRLEAMDAYAQSKLALTMWSRQMANELGASGPAVIAVNPGSLLASKMVRDGFGVSGNDIGIGARILVQTALGDEFADASGRYFDNDIGDFAEMHGAGLDPSVNAALMRLLEGYLD